MPRLPSKLAVSGLREKEGLTYGIGSSLLSINENTFLQIKSTTPYKKGTEVVQKVTDIIESFEEYLSDEYLEDMKRLASVSFLKSMENVFSQISLFHSIKMDGVSPEFYNTLLEGIKSVTKDDLLKVNDKILQKEKLIIIVE